MKMKRAFQPRIIDRAIFTILAAGNFASGLYTIGPWYLTITDVGRSPLMALFQSSNVIPIFGAALLLDGALLLYSATRNFNSKGYTKIVNSALLAGFFLRLYALLGVFLTIESWRPPVYIPQTGVVLIYASYWVWVRVYERTIR